MDMEVVDVTAADQCMFGLKTWGVICMGFMKRLRNKECHVKKILELTEHTTMGEIPEEETVDFDVEAWDDVTGKALDPKAVRQARLKEMKYVKEKEVWQPISRDEARRRGWKVVKTRWIDINKGDEDTPNYRSRLVAKEFNDGAGEGLFASTPPLEALRFLISEAATVRVGEDWEAKVIMVNDVARAFFEAPMRRDICLKLPAEAGEGEDMVGHLIMCLHLTRDAAANFQEEVRSFMNKADQSKCSPSVYHNKECGLITLVHGDDFITVGIARTSGGSRTSSRADSRSRQRFIGQGEGEDREERVLNQIIRVTTEGWEYEPHQRHADILIQATNLSGARESRRRARTRRTGR